MVKHHNVPEISVFVAGETHQLAALCWVPRLAPFWPTCKENKTAQHKQLLRRFLLFVCETFSAVSTNLRAEASLTSGTKCFTSKFYCTQMHQSASCSHTCRVSQTSSTSSRHSSSVATIKKQPGKQACIAVLAGPQSMYSNVKQICADINYGSGRVTQPFLAVHRQAYSL